MHVFRPSATYIKRDETETADTEKEIVGETHRRCVKEIKKDAPYNSETLTSQSSFALGVGLRSGWETN